MLSETEISDGSAIHMIILFAFLGAVYPAIDLGAGEKERHTLETLLLAPSARTEIAVGKLLVIFLTSLVAAALGTMSIGPNGVRAHLVISELPFELSNRPM